MKNIEISKRERTLFNIRTYHNLVENNLNRGLIIWTALVIVVFEIVFFIKSIEYFLLGIAFALFLSLASLIFISFAVDNLNKFRKEIEKIKKC